MGMFDFIFKPASTPTPAPELGLTIHIESEGFRLQAGPKSPVKDGDRLYLAYRCGSDDWVRTEIDFRKESGGMFVFTGNRPTNVVVTSHKMIQSARRNDDVPVSIFSQDRHDDSSSSCVLSDLLDPLNPLSPLSPFSLWNSPSPRDFESNFHSSSTHHHAPQSRDWIDGGNDPFGTDITLPETHRVDNSGPADALHPANVDAPELKIEPETTSPTDELPQTEWNDIPAAESEAFSPADSEPSAY